MSSVLDIPVGELIKASEATASTWYYAQGKPETITIQFILSLCNNLHIPVRRFFSFGNADVIGRREDYITDPYLPCHYDGKTLRTTVGTRSDATWQKAAKATKMSASRLRNSLIGATRTPVVRFLTVCKVFDINPFTILIDPNPEPPTPISSPARNDEIAALQQEMQELHAEMRDLRAKYEALLADHERLSMRVSMSIDTFNNNGYMSIAAEPQQHKKCPASSRRGALQTDL